MDKTALILQDVRDIQADTKPVYFQYRLRFSINGTSLLVPIIDAIDIVADYINGFGDEIMVTCRVVDGDYATLIYPNRKSLTATLERTPLGTLTNSIDTSSNVNTIVYSATIDDRKDPNLEDTSTSRSQPLTDRQLNMKTIMVQLRELPLALLQHERVGNLYHNLSPADTVKLIVMSKVSTMSLRKDARPLGVVLENPDVTGRMENVIVKQGVPLTDIAHYAQYSLHGIFNTGIGMYYHQRYWWVYPLFDSRRFTTTKYRTAVVYRVFSGSLPLTDRSYTITENQIRIIATGGINANDSEDINYEQEGNGIRYANADTLFDSFVTNSQGRSTAERAGLMNEFITSERPNGRTVAPIGPARVNRCRYLSELAARKSQIVQFKWDLARDDILYPGMPIKFIYDNGDAILNKQGQIAAVEYFIKPLGSGITNNRYQITAYVTSYVQNVTSQ